MATFEQVISGFGVDRGEVKNSNSVKTPIELYVQESAQVFIDKMKIHIEKEGANASFVLSQSLKSTPSNDGGVISIEFDSSENYALFRNDGVSGTERPRETPYSFKSTHPSLDMVNDIREWIRAKGFTAPEWAVATNVLKYGYEGAHYIERAFNKENLSIFENDLLIVVANTVDGIMTRIEPRFK